MQQLLMYNKTEEENDYLESLFIKPFCERYCDDATPQKNTKFSPSEDECKQTKRQTCHIYNPATQMQANGTRKMSVNETRRKYAEQNNVNKSHLTPYLCRKNQQKGFAKQIRKQLIQKDKQLPLSLELTQQNWLIIKEVHSKINQMRDHTNNSQINTKGIYAQEQSSQSRHNSIKNEIQTPHGKQEAKNIKTMMSYYKNKRLIKHMTKMSDNINLSNSEIKQSVNLRIQNLSAVKSKSKQANNTENTKLGKSTKRKSYIRQKGVKTEHSSPFIDQVKSRLVQAISSNCSSMTSFQLKDFLRSSKIGMHSKQNRPRTEVCLKRSAHISPSKPHRFTNSSKQNEFSAWQNSSEKLEGESLILI